MPAQKALPGAQSPWEGTPVHRWDEGPRSPGVEGTAGLGSPPSPSSAQSPLDQPPVQVQKPLLVTSWSLPGQLEASSVPPSTEGVGAGQTSEFLTERCMFQKMKYSEHTATVKARTARAYCPLSASPRERRPLTLCSSPSSHVLRGPWDQGDVSKSPHLPCTPSTGDRRRPCSMIPSSGHPGPAPPPHISSVSLITSQPVCTLLDLWDVGTGMSTPVHRPLPVQLTLQRNRASH